MTISRENSGALFRVAAEDRKSGKWPEFEGDFATTCPHCQQAGNGWVKAWVKETNAGKFFSLAFKFKEKRQ